MPDSPPPSRFHEALHCTKCKVLSVSPVNTKLCGDPVATLLWLSAHAQKAATLAKGPPVDAVCGQQRTVSPFVPVAVTVKPPLEGVASAIAVGDVPTPVMYEVGLVEYLDDGLSSRFQELAHLI